MNNWKLPLMYYNSTSLGLSYINGIILTNASVHGETITYIDPQSGVITGTVENIKRDTYGYHPTGDFIYFVCGTKITKLDFLKRKIIWEFESPYKSEYPFRQHMALDAANDLIYITDYGNFYCFKINK